MSLEKEFLNNIEVHKCVIFKISKMYADSVFDREDLFQDIIYQSWRSYSNFRGDSKFSTWLYRVALNTAITFITKERKSPVLYDNDKVLNSSLSYDLEDDEHSARLDLMYSAIQKLTPIDKMLIFYFLEGYSGEDMAQEIGLSEGNTRVKLNRAKTKLKEIIKSRNK